MKGYARVVMIALAALAAGAYCAGAATRFVAPLVALLLQTVGQTEHWLSVVIGFETGAGVRGLVLKLTALIPDPARGPAGGAMVIATVTSGAQMQILVSFWSVLLALPAASWRERLATTCAGVPLSLCLMTLAAACQLLAPCYATMSMMTERSDAVTLWERASNLLESGGRVVLSAVAAGLVMALARRTCSTRSPSVRAALQAAAPLRSPP